VQLKFYRVCLVVFFMCVLTSQFGCARPYSQQRAYNKYVKSSPALEHLYTTDVYNIYYDTVLQKCVMHSITHLAGNGTGVGVGVGISEFDCDVDEIRKRVKELQQ